LVKQRATSKFAINQSKINFRLLDVLEDTTTDTDTKVASNLFHILL